MPYQTPVTIAKVIKRVHNHELVLPAVQREFVWRTNQICRLFDSLMQDYPIGSVLFWKVEPQHAADYVYYDFMRDYHQLKAPHLTKAVIIQGQGVTAVLDGQQRLTALNIGLSGSYAERIAYKWATNPDAYPVKRLYLNLCVAAPENELGMKYDFQFLTEEDANERNAKPNGDHWFPVSKVLQLDPGYGVHKHLQSINLANHDAASQTLYKLHNVVHSDLVINYYDEETQDADKMLNVFIRINSGGTELSYSDVLLSIATAQWHKIDAKEAVYDLVGGLNATGQGFAFSKDLVLKSGLVLADIPAIGFKVTNFNAANMATLEREWSGISKALKLAVRLLADFGFSAKTLPADSVVIPVAYFLHRLSPPDNYLTSPKYADDREAIRLWVTRSVLKRGIWGSGLDTLLGYLRATIKEHESKSFPTPELGVVMAQRGKSLQLGDAELNDLLNINFGDKRSLPLLSLLYPGTNFHNTFHVDHVFPRSLFTRKRLVTDGIPEKCIDSYLENVNAIPNLQLLEGSVNVSKQAKLPHEWIAEYYKDPKAGDAYRARYDLMDLPDSLAEFGSFFAARRELMRGRLQQLLVVAPTLSGSPVQSVA